MLAVGQRRFVGDQRQQAVQLERVDPQPRGEAAEHAGAIVLGQIFGERQAGVGDVLLVAAIGAAGPIGRIEQLAIGGDGLDAGERVGRAHQPDQLRARADCRAAVAAISSRLPSAAVPTPAMTFTG